MAQNVELLLLNTIDNLGIIGDVVKVKAGYARNYLLPRQLATVPTQELIDSLSEQRTEARAELEKRQAEQQAMMEKLDGYEIVMERSSNDSGVLFGGVTQHEIAEALREAEFAVEDRYVRLGEQIKRVDTYVVPVVINKDLKGEITLVVNSDRELEETEDLELDDEGEVVNHLPSTSPLPNAPADPEAPADAADAVDAAVS